MKQVTDINVGEIEVSARKIILRAIALGSCIGLAAYDSVNRIGAVAHIMLPGRAPSKSAEKTRYAEDAVEQLLLRMADAGAVKRNIQACLVGAGNVLEKDDDTICCSNIASVTRILRDSDIPVKASLLGGTRRKSVSLDVETGRVLSTEGDDAKQLLWSFTSENGLRIAANLH